MDEEKEGNMQQQQQQTTLQQPQHDVSQQQQLDTLQKQQFEAPQQQQYEAPQPQQNDAPQNTNANANQELQTKTQCLASTSLCLGAVSCCSYGGLCGCGAIILGVLACHNVRRNEATECDRTLASGGVVLGLAGLVGLIIMITHWILFTLVWKEAVVVAETSAELYKDGVHHMADKAEKDFHNENENHNNHGGFRNLRKQALEPTDEEWKTGTTNEWNPTSGEVEDATTAKPKSKRSPLLRLDRREAFKIVRERIRG